MRITSAEDPAAMGVPADPAVEAPVEAPVEVTRTMACTSVPPSGRNSFWNTSAVKSAMGRLLFL